MYDRNEIGRVIVLCREEKTLLVLGHNSDRIN
jgi:hypothetical protein